MFCIGIVVGESSGDLLAAELVESLLQLNPNIKVVGILGPKLRALGGHAYFEMEKLNVMGFFEVVKHLPRLYKIKRQLLTYFKSSPPDVFIGVDYQEFNLALEKDIRSLNIPTIHYVSPTVWAWRPKRIYKVAKACDHLLTVFPFEARYYQDTQLPVTFVGHPLAKSLQPLAPAQARQQLGLPTDKKVITLLPGSRMSELQQLAKLFLQTAELLQEKGDYLFLLPTVDDEKYDVLKKLIEDNFSTLPLYLLRGQSHQAISAADVVLTASGTATLECLLLERPMVVAYRLTPLTYFFAKRLIKLPNIALPNILAGEKLVPEFIQAQVQPQLLAESLSHYLNNELDLMNLKQQFQLLRGKLIAESNSAAKLILKYSAGYVIGSRGQAAG